MLVKNRCVQSRPTRILRAYFKVHEIKIRTREKLYSKHFSKYTKLRAGLKIQSKMRFMNQNTSVKYTYFKTHLITAG